MTGRQFCSQIRNIAVPSALSVYTAPVYTAPVYTVPIPEGRMEAESLDLHHCCCGVCVLFVVFLPVIMSWRQMSSPQALGLLLYAALIYPRKHLGFFPVVIHSSEGRGFCD